MLAQDQLSTPVQGEVTHGLFRQRVSLSGYDNCDDADELRSDPLPQAACDRHSVKNPDLASQPMFSRFEVPGRFDLFRST